MTKQYNEGDHIWLRAVSADDPEYGIGYDQPAQRATILDIQERFPGMFTCRIIDADIVDDGEYDDGIREADFSQIDERLGSW